MGNCLNISNKHSKSDNLPDTNEKNRQNVKDNIILVQEPTDIPEKHVDDISNPHDFFTLDGDTCVGYCVSVYDGDTCTFNLKTKIGIHKWKIRLLGLDAPELKTKDELEKMHAKACRDTLAEWIQYKECHVKCSGYDKYGRLLAVIYAQDKNDLSKSKDLETIGNQKNYIDVNDWLIKNTPCVPYDGKTKQKIKYDENSFDPIYLKHLEKHKRIS